jgi:hypothetical protein
MVRERTVRAFTAPQKTRMLALLSVLAFFSWLILPLTKVTAAVLDNRKIEILSSSAAVTTIHLFEYDIVTTGIVGSLEFEYCSNDPFPGQPCTAPTGLDVSSAVLDSQLGETGFSISIADSTINKIILTRVPVAVTPGQVRYQFSNVVNPDTLGSYYVRLGTFVTVNGSGSRTDTGGLAFSINTGINIGAYVPPILIFCLGGSITGTNCATSTNANLNFGEFSEFQTKSGTTEIVAGTNGVGGYTISVTGNTMTSGNNIIPALAVQSGASTGNARFGFNLVNNAVPNVGADVIGVGTGVPTAEYDDPNLFKFLSGDLIANSPFSTDLNKFTISYIVDIDPGQPPGVYTTTMTFICLATF